VAVSKASLVNLVLLCKNGRPPDGLPSYTLSVLPARDHEPARRWLTRPTAQLDACAGLRPDTERATDGYQLADVVRRMIGHEQERP